MPEDVKKFIEDYIDLCNKAGLYFEGVEYNPYVKRFKSRKEKERYMLFLDTLPIWNK